MALGARIWLAAGLWSTLLVLLGSGAAPLTVSGARELAAGSPHTPFPGAQLSSEKLAEASASLARGEGPASGHDPGCPIRTGSSPACDSHHHPPTSLGVSGGANWTPRETLPYVGSWWPAGQSDLVYDASDGYVLEYGGISGFDALGQTWKFDGTRWQQIVTNSSPPSGALFFLVYDAADGYVVGAGSSPFTDTWTYHASVWTHLTLTSASAYRTAYTAAYDPFGGHVLIFGGLGSAGQMLQDTWQFAAGSWSELNSTLAPGPRYNALLAPDLADGYMVLFGGYGINSGVTGQENDTWTLASGQWTLVHSTLSPIPIQGSGASYMTYDSTDGYVLLLGPCAYGVCSPYAQNGIIWSFSAGQWSIVNSTGVTGEVDSNLVDVPSERAVLALGHPPGTGAVYPSIYSYTNGTWTETDPMPTPAPGGPYPMTYDAADGYVVLLAVDPNEFHASEMLFWIYQNATWRVGNIGGPPARVGASLVYDSTLREVLLFGGSSYAGSQFLSDLWTISSAGVFQVQQAAGSAWPEPRADAMMSDDSGDHAVVVFGGIDSNGWRSDTWVYDASGWTNVTSTIGPSPRLDATICDSPSGDYVLLFGGMSWAQAALGDTWEFHAGSWNNLTSLIGAAPSPRYESSMAFSLAENATILFGGEQGGPNGWSSSTVYNDTWAFRDGVWSNLTIAGGVAPPPRFAAAMTFDESDGYMVLFGGTACLTCGSYVFGQLGDTWLRVTGLPAGPNISSFTVTPGRIDVGGLTTLQVNATGGMGNLTLSYAGLPPGCSTVNDATLNCTPTAPGSYTLTLSVQDTVGRDVMATAHLLVAPDPSIVSFAPVFSSVPFGAQARFQSEVSGGTGPYQYAYGGLPPGCVGATVASFNCTPTVVGTFSIQLTVLDSFLHSTSAHTTLEVLLPAGPFIRGFSISPSTATVGSTIVLSVDALDPWQPLAFEYSGLPPGCPSKNGADVVCSPTTAGGYLVTVNVTDPFGTVVRATAALLVLPAPTTNSPLEMVSFVASPAVVYPGSEAVFQVTVTGGEPPLTYQYAALPPGCISADQAQLPCSPSAKGNFSVEVTVTDGVGDQANAYALLVVSPAVATGTTSPASPSGLPLGVGIGVGVGVVVGAGIVALLLARRRPPPARATRPTKP